MTTRDSFLSWLLVEVEDRGEWFVELWGMQHDIPSYNPGDQVLDIALLESRVAPESFEHPADALNPPARFIGGFGSRHDIARILSAAHVIGAVTSRKQLRFLRTIACMSVRAQRYILKRGAPLAPMFAPHQEIAADPWLIVKAYTRRGRFNTFLVSLAHHAYSEWLYANPEACLGDRLPEYVAEQSPEFLGFGTGTAIILAYLPLDVCAYLSACAPFYPPHQPGPLSDALRVADAAIDAGVILDTRSAASRATTARGTQPCS